MLVMTTMSTSRPARGSLIVLICLIGVWLLWSLWFTMAPDINPGGQCSGLGFGCTLTPRDFAQFAGAIVVAPLSIFVAAITLVVRIVRIGRGSARTVWDLLLGGLLLGAGVFWGLSTVVGSF